VPLKDMRRQLRNAVGILADQGRLEYTAKNRGKQLVIPFSGLGTGITAENQRLVFTAFFTPGYRPFLYEGSIRLSMQAVPVQTF